MKLHQIWREDNASCAQYKYVFCSAASLCVFAQLKKIIMGHADTSNLIFSESNRDNLSIFAPKDATRRALPTL